MKNSFISFLILFCFSANSAVRDYQNILMNESASLLDLTIFSANIKAEIYEQKLDYDNFIFNINDNLENFDWNKKKNIKDKLNLPIKTPLNVKSFFDFDNGKFVFDQEVVWRLYSLEESFEESFVKLKTTQKNMTSICSILLRDMAGQLTIYPQLHAGYSTEKTLKLPENLLGKAIEDTVYKVKIYLHNFVGNYPYLTCEADKDNIFNENGNVTYEFVGDWHQLESIIKKVRRIAGFAD